MAEAIVHFLEVVEVDHHNRELTAVDGGIFERRLQPPLELTPVQKAGERTWLASCDTVAPGDARR